MGEKSQKLNNKNDYPIFGVDDRKNQIRLEQNFAQDFIANYISYGNAKELEEIMSRINGMGLVNISIKRLFEPDHSTYDPHYIIPYVKNTKLENNKVLAPFIASKNFRERIVSPENRFSTIAVDYLDFIRFLQLLVIDIKVASEFQNEDNVKNLNEKVRKNIDFQLKSKKKGSNFLVTFSFDLCLQKHKQSIYCFDLDKFELIIYEIVFSGDKPVIYPMDEKIRKNYVRSEDIEKLENEIKKHNKKNHTHRTDFNSFNLLCTQIRKLIINYHKGVIKHTECSICKRRKFQRSKVKGSKTNTQYCPECTKLINIILEVKGNLNKNIDRASIIKSLTKPPKTTKRKKTKENNAKYYCEHLLTNVTKRTGMSDLLLEKLGKQVNKVFYSEI